MPAERLTMRKIREVLRLSLGGKHSSQLVALSCGVGRTMVRGYLQRARRAGLSWPLPMTPPDLRAFHEYSLNPRLIQRNLLTSGINPPRQNQP